MDALRRSFRKVTHLRERLHAKGSTVMMVVYIILILVATVLFGSVVYLFTDATQDTVAMDTPTIQEKLEPAPSATSATTPDNKGEDNPENSTNSSASEGQSASQPDAAPGTVHASPTKQPVSETLHQATETIRKVSESLLTGETTRQIIEDTQDKDGCGGLLGLDSQKYANCLNGAVSTLPL